MINLKEIKEKTFSLADILESRYDERFYGI